MKKMMLLLSLFVIFGFTGCKKSSEEGKEKQQRILKVVGIPHNIILNICQDNNENGFCDSVDINAKITIARDDTAKDIWEKVKLSPDGSYLLAHHDPTKNIIMEMQDSENLRYNGGRFSFFYNPMTRELSLLQALVDSGYLTQESILSAQEIDNRVSFDAILLKSFFYNQNLLMSNDLNLSVAMGSNFQYIADALKELDIASSLPARIDACNGEQLCMNNILNPSMLRLEIDNDEVAKIVQKRSKPYTIDSLTGSSSGDLDIRLGTAPTTVTPTVAPIATTPPPTATTTPIATTPPPSNTTSDRPIATTPPPTTTPIVTTPPPTPTESEPEVTPIPESNSEKNGADGYIVKLGSRATATCLDGQTYYSESTVGAKGKIVFDALLADDCIVTIPKGATIDANNNGYADSKDKILAFDMRAFANSEFISPLTTLLVAKKERGENLPSYETIIKNFDPVEIANKITTQRGVEKLESQKLMVLMEILRVAMPYENLSLADIDLSSMVTHRGETIDSFDIESIIASLPTSIQREALKRATIMKQLSPLLDNLDSSKMNLATFMTNISDGGVNINAGIRRSKSSDTIFGVMDSFREVIDGSSDITKVETQLEHLNRLTNNAPIANAGEDQTVMEGSIITFDGSLSSDMDEDIVKYEWRDEKSVIGRGVTFRTSKFYAGKYTITLVVTDDVGATHSDDMVIEVKQREYVTPIPTIVPEPTLIPPAIKSFLKKTGQTTSYEQFDDGHYQVGRYTKYSRKNDIVTDNITGLMWQDDKEGIGVFKSWKDAKSHCLSLSLGGYSDWRLPTVEELETIILYGTSNSALDRIFNPTYSTFWTSTINPISSREAWTLNFYNREDSWSSITSENATRCVRGKKN